MVLGGYHHVGIFFRLVLNSLVYGVPRGFLARVQHGGVDQGIFGLATTDRQLGNGDLPDVVPHLFRLIRSFLGGGLGVFCGSVFGFTSTGLTQSVFCVMRGGGTHLRGDEQTLGREAELAVLYHFS